MILMLIALSIIGIIIASMLFKFIAFWSNRLTIIPINTLYYCLKYSSPNINKISLQGLEIISRYTTVTINPIRANSYLKFLINKPPKEILFKDVLSNMGILRRNRKFTKQDKEIFFLTLCSIVNMTINSWSQSDRRTVSLISFLDNTQGLGIRKLHDERGYRRITHENERETLKLIAQHLGIDPQTADSLYKQAMEQS